VRCLVRLEEEGVNFNEAGDVYDRYSLKDRPDSTEGITFDYPRTLPDGRRLYHLLQYRRARTMTLRLDGQWLPPPRGPWITLDRVVRYE
jgi:hypothetical protein